MRVGVKFIATNLIVACLKFVSFCRDEAGNSGCILSVEAAKETKSEAISQPVSWFTSRTYREIMVYSADYRQRAFSTHDSIKF